MSVINRSWTVQLNGFMRISLEVYNSGLITDFQPKAFSLDNVIYICKYSQLLISWI